MKKLAVALAILAALGLLLLVLGPELGLTGQARQGPGALSGGPSWATAESLPGAPTPEAPGTDGPAQAPAWAASSAAAPDAPPPSWVPAEAIAGGRGAIVATVVLRPGIPAAGAVADLAGPSVRQGFSDDQGHLIFGSLAPGSGYRVQVSSIGYEPTVRTALAVRGGKVTDLGLLDLSGGSGRGPVNGVSVLVTRKDDKKAVSGATVTLTNVRPYGTYLAFGTKEKPGSIA
ncbi:MAG: carboxypeptidase-like regulatory domain-containing protein, partial [Planctomycetales bacterium]|nr:carboxypeptidase-like regulatory domain-containing protein [Planctomycetales bacterium]